MRSIARVRRRKKGQHLRQAEQQRWREAEEEREAEKHSQGQLEQAFEQQFEEGDWWRVLEVSPDAGMDEIRGAYRHKIRQSHPDHVSGLAPGLLELAERRAKALNAAYSQAMRAQEGIHPFQRVWPPIMIGIMFVVEVVWIVLLVYLSMVLMRAFLRP
jgi:DnaJ domain